VIAADTSGTQGTNVHDITETDGGLTTSGTLAVTDVDVTNTVTASVFDVAIGGTGATYLPQGLDSATLKTMLSVDTGNVIGNADTTGTIHWTFDSGQQAFDFLAAGETLVLTYTIRATDSDSTQATGDQTVVVTITGTNDAPTVAATTMPTTLVDTAAADTFATQTGSLVGSDPDSGETASLTYTAYDSATSTYGNSAVVGQYGSLTVNSNGTYSYVPDAVAINALDADSYTDTFTVQTTDIHGASGIATFTVNVTGANDAPTIVADTPAHLVEATSSDAGTPVSVAALTIADVDGTANYDTTELLANGWIYNSVDDTYTKAGTYGAAMLDAAHNLTYALDNNLADGLTSSDHPVETFRVPVIDNHGLTAFTDVSFTVDGSDDGPTISSDGFQVSGAGGPTDPTTVTGLSVSDPDADDMFTVTASALSGSSVSAANGDPLPTGPMTLSAVNELLTDGIKYDPTTAPETDRLTVTITDNHQLSDTLNFIFNQTGPNGATLAGTTDKDVFFATESPDTFVFAPNSNHDTIIEFAANSDVIDLAFLNSSETNSSWLAAAAESVNNDTDTLIHINGTTDTLLLKGVALATLNASDFILHA